MGPDDGALPPARRRQGPVRRGVAHHRRWRELDAPAPGSTSGRRAHRSADSVSAVHFADPQHGWVYDRNLFATFNGGRRWRAGRSRQPGRGRRVVGTVGLRPGRGLRRRASATATPRCGCSRARSPPAGGGSSNLGFDLPPTDIGSLVVSRSGVYAVGRAGIWSRRSWPGPAAGAGNGARFPAPAPWWRGIEAEEGLVAACRPPSRPARWSCRHRRTAAGPGRWSGSTRSPSPVTSLAVTGAGHGRRPRERRRRSAPSTTG